jgi:uncharacterized membrane protein
VKNQKRIPNSDNHHNGNSKQSPSDHAIEAVAKIERTAYETRSRMDHFADTITRFAGSGTAILLHLIWFFLWLIVNLHFIPRVTPFDPFPFNLLTMVVSIEAIYSSHSLFSLARTACRKKPTNEHSLIFK